MIRDDCQPCCNWRYLARASSTLDNQRSRRSEMIKVYVPQPLFTARYAGSVRASTSARSSCARSSCARSRSILCANSYSGLLFGSWSRSSVALVRARNSSQAVSGLDDDFRYATVSESTSASYIRRLASACSSFMADTFSGVEAASCSFCRRPPKWLIARQYFCQKCGFQRHQPLVPGWHFALISNFDVDAGAVAKCRSVTGAPRRRVASLISEWEVRSLGLHSG